MSIAATDLISYCSASRPEDDTSLAGGAIDTTKRPSFTQWTANAVAAIVSDGADTRTVTVYGRDATGAFTNQNLVADGTNEVVGTVVFERILKITVSAASGTRTITIKQGAGGSTRATIPPNETGVAAMFINSASAATAKVRYEKLFWRNSHASLTLNAAQVTLTADPSAKIKIGLEAAKNDSNSVANRLAVPAGVTFVDDNVAQNVPGTTLEAASAIGVWVEQSLAINDIAYRSSYTTQLTGSSV